MSSRTYMVKIITRLSIQHKICKRTLALSISRNSTVLYAVVRRLLKRGQKNPVYDNCNKSIIFLIVDCAHYSKTFKSRGWKISAMFISHKTMNTAKFTFRFSCKQSPQKKTFTAHESMKSLLLNSNIKQTFKIN